MATLDDKLMGEKLHYYCSSSEDEDEPEPPPQGADGQPLQQPTPGKYLTETGAYPQLPTQPKFF